MSSEDVFLMTSPTAPTKPFNSFKIHAPFSERPSHHLRLFSLHYTIKTISNGPTLSITTTSFRAAVENRIRTMTLCKYKLKTICDTNKQSVCLPVIIGIFGKVPPVMTPELRVCLQTFDLFVWFWRTFRGSCWLVVVAHSNRTVDGRLFSHNQLLWLSGPPALSTETDLICFG